MMFWKSWPEDTRTGFINMCNVIVCNTLCTAWTSLFFFLVVTLKVKNKALENEFSVTEDNEEPTYRKKKIGIWHDYGSVTFVRSFLFSDQ
jgi:hypothetical protein